MISKSAPPSSEKIQQAFDAIYAGKTTPLVGLLYLDPVSFYKQKNPDGSGGTLVHAAVERDQLACLGLLMKKGFSVLETDDEGRNPLHLARSPQSAIMILQAAKEHARSMLVEQDFMGNLPHHRLAQNGHSQTLTCLLRVVPNNREFMLRPNARGDTVLHELARHLPELIPEILSVSMDVRAKNLAGETAWDLCTSNKKSRTFLGAHTTVRNDAEDRARNMLHSHAQNAASIKAAEMAKAFVKRESGTENFEMRP